MGLFPNKHTKIDTDNNIPEISNEAINLIDFNEPS